MIKIKSYARFSKLKINEIQELAEIIIKPFQMILL